MTDVNAEVIKRAIVVFLLTGLIASTAIASSAIPQTCDLTSVSPALACLEKGKKCHIKFVNNTGLDCCLDKHQMTGAMSIRVAAHKSDETKAGKNALVILAGQNKTLNLDKKKDFQHIIVKAVAALIDTQEAVLSCSDIKSTLQGNAVCRAYLDLKFNTRSIALSCNGAVIERKR